MSNELATVNVNTMMGSEVGSTYCSIAVNGDRAQAAKVFNAINNPEYKVSEFINKEIAVKDVLIEIVAVESEETGELSEIPRTVLIDENGKAYQATSVGMFNVVKNAINVFGPAPWNDPLIFTIKQIPTKRGSMLTADIH